MKTYTEIELNEILEKHRKWLRAEEGGRRAELCDTDLHNVNLRGAELNSANLSGANLSGANLYGADLGYTNLGGADLCGANLCNADLYNANLRGAYLCTANLYSASLHNADLRGADFNKANLHNAILRYANLCGANFRNANLFNVDYNGNTTFFALQCPEVGSFIGWKKADIYIVKLEICEDALRSSATSRKCRCSKAKVLSIENINGTTADIESIRSNRDRDFIYKVGETVEVEDFDTDRWNECSTGIHFFITRDEAVNY